MRRPIAGILLIAALLLGGGLIATTAYQAGLSTAVTTVATTPIDGSTGATVTPVLVPGGYGYGFGANGFGWGPGFGFFGFLGTLLFIVLIVGLLRAVFGRGRGAGRWGGPGGVHQTFEAWHREAHGGSAPGATTSADARSN